MLAAIRKVLGVESVKDEAGNVIREASLFVKCLYLSGQASSNGSLDIAIAEINYWGVTVG